MRWVRLDHADLTKAKMKNVKLGGAQLPHAILVEAEVPESGCVAIVANEKK